jgi:hypothetical protein
MTLRKILLCGAAAALLAVPALAQDTDYRQNSTPEERAQTQSLNQNAQGGTVSPAAQATYEAQQQQYMQQQQDYRAKRADYRAQRARYETQRAHYEAQRGVYYATVSGDPWAVPTAAPPPYPDEDRLSPLYVVEHPSRDLARAPLVDRDGHWVGRVRDVDTRNGFAHRVKIYLYRDRRYVWLRPSLLRYDASDGVLYTRLDYRDLRDLPRA